MKKKSSIILSALPLLTLGLCSIPHFAFASETTDGEVVMVSSMGAQQKMNEIRGVVLDGNTGEPIIGAAIKVKGAINGTTTNIDGEFVLKVAKGDVLIISYMGYVSKEITVTNVKTYTVELSESSELLGEVVVTAFGVGQKKESMVGAVTQIKPAELKVPSSSLSSSFAGRLSGVIAVQRSGEPGADGADFWIRGKSTFSSGSGALIVLDGVEISAAELNALDAEAIESFSILKDATATALYGSRGANGVMIVTTKSGKDLDKPIINFRLEGALTSLSKVPEMADGVTFMNCYNETVTRTTSKATPYTQEKIDATRQRLNPYVYPDVDWYDEMFKKNAFSQRANFNIRGGSKKMDYFMSVGIKHSDGNMRSLSKDYGFSYDNNINVTNYDFINNLNVQATSTTKLSLGLNASVKSWKGPNGKPSDFFGLTLISNPVDFPISYPAGIGGIETEDIMWGDKAGGPYNTGYRNPVAEFVSGYKTNTTSIITANFKIEQDLGMFVKGLKFNGLFSFKNKSVDEAYRSSAYNAFEVDTYDSATNSYTLRRTAGEYGTELKTSGGHDSERNTYLQAVLDYKNTFNEKHDVNAMFLFNRQEFNTKVTNLFSSLPRRKQGIAGRVSYSYDGRYMAEANFGYNGSENFAANHRYGFFPSIAVGYNISNEKFWENIRPVISNLKLRASWGLVGNDNTLNTVGRFAYLEELSLTGAPSYKTGLPGGKYTGSGPKWTRYYTPDLRWEVGEKWNFGVDLQFCNSLNFTAEAFKEVRRDIYIPDAVIPDFLGMAGAKIYSNLGKMKNVGMDMSLDYGKQINKNFFLSFKSTFTYAHNTILYYNEPAFLDYPNLSRVGHSADQRLLWVAHGLFPDEKTIKNNPTQNLGYAPQPGDIWYKNMPNRNGEYDSVIDANDRMWIGNPSTPEIIYGFGPSIRYKKWDFSFFFQGAAKTSILMSGMHPFGNVSIRGLFKYIADDHWSLDNPNINAKYPRLTKEDNDNNTKNSTYWLRNGSFLKLKNAEVGYTLRGWRFYVSGQNLLTFSPFDYWDPEMGSGSGLKYPTQRVINFGVQVTFNNK